MKILDNKQGRTVENELSQRIDNSTIVSISTGMFSIYAFYLLREKMKHIKGLNILLLTNPQTNKANGVSIAMDNSFWGTSENAVRIQIHVVIITYCLIAIVEHDFKLGRPVVEVMRIMGSALLVKDTIQELFEPLAQEQANGNEQQLCIEFTYD